jgi:hypothetical protein
VKENKEFHKRLPEVEFVDRITIDVVPRFKTSGLSGDVWRHSAVVRFFHKGEQVHEFSRGRVSYAAAHLSWELDTFADGAVLPSAEIKREETLCDNPGCGNPARVKMYLKREFSSRGEALDPSEQHFRHYRKFCGEHRKRGDASREDCDDNYRDHEILGGSEMPVRTSEKLAQVLHAAGLFDLERRARAFEFDDYKSQHATPIMNLVAALREAGHEDLAQRAIGGEWDSQVWESEEWARSEEGRATLKEAGPVIEKMLGPKN